MIHITLNQLKKDCMGIVMELKGGYHLINKLNALGIREGIVIAKESDSFLRGPVTVKVGQSKVAIGYGMADKILVKMVDNR